MIRPVLQGDALVADVDATGDSSDDLHLWWLGQSGFLVRWRETFLLFDPYLSDSLTRKYQNTDKPHVRMTEQVIAPERLDFVNVVTSSHNHTDHLDAETLRPLMTAIPDLTVIVPAANQSFAADRLGVPASRLTPIDPGQSERVNEITLHAIPAAHNELETDDQGRHKFIGLVAEIGPWRVYHSGDTLLYDGMTERLRDLQPDIAIVPINGNVPARRVAGNLDGQEAAQLAKDVGAKMAIPHHFEMFEFNTVSPDLFIQSCRELNQPFKVLRNGERWSTSSL